MDYDFDLRPDADNAAVGKYIKVLSQAILPAIFLFAAELQKILKSGKTGGLENKKWKKQTNLSTN